MRTLQAAIPTTYLCRTETGWTVIHQEQQLTISNGTLADAFTTAARFKLTLSDWVWIAMQSRFGTLAEAKSV